MSGHPARDRLIQISLGLYAVFSLTAMAGMNLSFLFVALTFFYVLMRSSFKGPVALSGFTEFKLYLEFGGALFAACLLSLVVAKLSPIVYAGHAPDITVHGFLKIWYLLCPGILAVVFLSASRPIEIIKQVRRAWWIATIALSGVALVQFFTGWPLAQPIPTNPGRYHAILFFGHHLSTSSILIFPTFVALAHAIGKQVRTRTVDRFAWATGLAGLLILFLSYARAAWLSVPIGIMLLFFRYLSRRVGFIAILALAIILALSSQLSLVKERVENTMGITDRLRLWQANIDFFKHNPVTGIGWLKTQEMSEFYFKQNFPDHYHEYFWGHAHNNFFEMLGGTGLVGVAAFMAWSGFTFWLAFRTSRPEVFAFAPDAMIETRAELNDLAYGLGVALVLLHINGLTNVTFWEGKVMHQQMFAVGLLLTVRALQKRDVAQDTI